MGSVRLVPSKAAFLLVCPIALSGTRAPAILRAGAVCAEVRCVSATPPEVWWGVAGDSIPPCQFALPDTSGWTVVRIGETNLIVRLPSDISEEAMGAGVAFGTSPDARRIANGVGMRRFQSADSALLIHITLVPKPVGRVVRKSANADSHECTYQAGGRRVAVIFDVRHEPRRSVHPGTYVVMAIMPSGSDSSVIINAYADNPAAQARVRTILATVESFPH